LDTLPPGVGREHAVARTAERREISLAAALVGVKPREKT
jgi:hypothetical protein